MRTNPNSMTKESDQEAEFVKWAREEEGLSTRLINCLRMILWRRTPSSELLPENAKSVTLKELAAQSGSGEITRAQFLRWQDRLGRNLI